MSTDVKNSESDGGRQIVCDQFLTLYLAKKGPCKKKSNSTLNPSPIYPPPSPVLPYDTLPPIFNLLRHLTLYDILLCVTLPLLFLCVQRRGKMSGCRKMFERILDKIIRQRVNIDEMQYGFMPGRGTTDAIFILRQLQERYLQKNKRLYYVFIDLEKAFDRNLSQVLW